MKQEKPKRTRKQWLDFIKRQLEQFKDHCFFVGTERYISTLYRQDEPFVWRFLVTAGVLVKVGELRDRAGGVRADEKDPNSRRKVLEILDQAVQNYYPATKTHAPLIVADPLINLRAIYQLDGGRADQIGSWSYWTKEGGGKVVAAVAITRVATTKGLNLKNPSGRSPDRTWDGQDPEHHCD